MNRRKALTALAGLVATPSALLRLRPSEADAIIADIEAGYRRMAELSREGEAIPLSVMRGEGAHMVPDGGYEAWATTPITEYYEIPWANGN